MTYATIMVSLASDQSNERCLAVAGEMVERFDARVIGIAAAEFSPPLYFTSGDDGVPTLLNQHIGLLRHDCRSLSPSSERS